MRKDVKVTGDDDEQAAPDTHRPPGPDDAEADRALGVALDELITAVQETKQALWLTSDLERRRALEALRVFLVERAIEAGDAEARIDGRSPMLVSPTGRRPPNLAARAGGDQLAMMELLLADLEALLADVRQLGRQIAGREEERLLARLAEGLEEHLALLRD